MGRKGLFYPQMFSGKMLILGKKPLRPHDSSHAIQFQLTTDVQRFQVQHEPFETFGKIFRFSDPIRLPALPHLGRKPLWILYIHQLIANSQDQDTFAGGKIDYTGVNIH